MREGERRKKEKCDRYGERNKKRSVIVRERETDRGERERERERE